MVERYPTNNKYRLKCISTTSIIVMMAPHHAYCINTHNELKVFKVLAFLSDEKEGIEHIDSIESNKDKESDIKGIASQRLICEPVHRVKIIHFGDKLALSNRFICKLPK